MAVCCTSVCGGRIPQMFPLSWRYTALQRPIWHGHPWRINCPTYISLHPTCAGEAAARTCPDPGGWPGMPRIWRE
jgi:hypothetical protein